MFEIKDIKGKLIKSWEINSDFKSLIFSVHTTDVLHVYQDHNAITIFYGFLDLDYGDNPAQFINDIFSHDGVDGLNSCYGSFIVLHYDINSHEITLTNDALGDFAAHYYISKDSIFISDLPDLLLNKGNSSIDEDRLIEHFALTKPEENVGFFQDIKQVNPGQYIIFSNQNIKKKLYYSPPQLVDYKSTCLDELSTKFRTLMQTAIKYQTQGQDRVGVMLSGGMDSTFVAANALKAGKKVSSYSYVFPNIPNANEAIWIDSMRSLGMDMNTFVGEPYWPLKSPVHVSINSPIINPYRPLKEVIYTQAESKNIKIILSGVFADHLYAGFIYWLVDLARKRPLTAIKALYSMMKSHGIKTGLRQVSPAKWSKKINLSAPWLNQKAFHKLKEMKTPNMKFNCSHPQQHALVYALSTAQFSWLDNEHANRHGLFVRHPFRDRRVVEFLMSIPAWILGTFDAPKKLVRNAAKDILPEAIIRRNQGTTLTPLFINGVLEKEFTKVHDLLTSSNCTWQNYIKKDLIDKILTNPKAVCQENDYVALWQCIGYELWLKRLENR